MNEQLNKFLINSIVFDEDPITAIKMNINSSISFDKILDLLSNFVEDFNDLQMLDDYIIENIFQIIAYIKEQYNYKNMEDKNTKYQIYNNLIKILNGGLKTNNEDFYLSQYLERGMQVDTGYKYNDYCLPETEKNYVRISICYDYFFYNILIKDRKKVSNKEIECLIMNSLFIYSLNYFRLECPYILENNSILKQVLIENRKILLGRKSQFTTKQLAFKTNSLKKYSKQLLKEIRWS